jgi:4'-phosphopantetheinyl transferase EntD
MICDEDELGQAAYNSKHARAEVAKILFSIKESIFKAYFPATTKFLDFKDVFVKVYWQSNVFKGDIIAAKQPDIFGTRGVSGRVDSQLDVVFAVAFVSAR